MFLDWRLRSLLIAVKQNRASQGRIRTEKGPERMKLTSVVLLVVNVPLYASTISLPPSEASTYIE